MKQYDNVVVEVSNYNTNALPRTLIQWGKSGYQLVSTQMVPNKHGIEIMLLFFTKELDS